MKSRRIVWTIGSEHSSPVIKQCDASFDAAPNFDRGRLDASQIRERHPTSSPQLLRLALAILISLTYLALSGCDRGGQSVNSDTANQTEVAPATEVSAITSQKLCR